MGKIYTLDEIRRRVKPVAERYGIEKVLLFGSYARGEATEESDIDLFICYKRLKGMFAIGGVYTDFEEAFGIDVDVVSEKALTADYATEKSRIFLANIVREGVSVYVKEN
ncbi:MAG: nucleotidyltransferase domain-containing protein [Bacteroides sp.]|nr:nucleotidyltransferase domain-containing protein [Bacteroides sp.]